MFNALPKRLKELPSLESDSEDDHRTPRLRSYVAERKGMLRQSAKSSLFQPKRVSELPRLESDSDDDIENDEENYSNLSPNANTDTQNNKKNENNSVRKTDMVDGADGTKLTKDVGIHKNPSDSSERSVNDSLSGHGRHSILHKRSRTKSMSIFRSRKLVLQPAVPISGNMPTKSWLNETTNPCDKERISLLGTAHVLDEPNEIMKSDCVDSASVDIPCKATVNIFATPQIKSFQVSESRHGNLQPLPYISQKSRDAIENEFRSQKILFTTPVVTSRRPIIPLVNDSITLSLDDSGPKNKGHLSPVLENKIYCSNKIYGGLADISGFEPVVQDISTTKINGKLYSLGQKIGSGGSSSVYLAQQVDTLKECALKIVNLRGDRNIVDGYLNETKLLVKLQDNVNIVALYDFFHNDKKSELYMVMERGESDLHKILQTFTGDLPLYTLITYVYQMFQCVDYIHTNGVIHSDLKPANFLMVNGRLKLIDFGIASNISFEATSIIKFSQAGTFNYISPEALIDTSSGNSPGHKSHPKIKLSTKSDVWSLGCILYLLLYKKTPFAHIKNVYAKVTAITKPLKEIDYQPLPIYYPPMLLEIVQKCLKHDPKERPSVADLLKYPFHMVIPLAAHNPPCL